MNLEKLKRQQAALQSHQSSNEYLAVLVNTFAAGYPGLSAAIIQEFTHLGLQACVSGGGYYLDVKVPPSERTVKIEALTRLDFNEMLLRSEFIVFRYANRLESGANRVAIVPQTPMSLPLTIRVGLTGGQIASIWWRGLSDNERVAKIVVALFQGHAGPEEIGPTYTGSCFVATVIFGEHSEEVSILRKWRDEHLSGSIVGRHLVRTYYRLGPSCAAFVQRNALVRRVIQTILSAVCLRLIEPSHLNGGSSCDATDR